MILSIVTCILLASLTLGEPQARPPRPPRPGDSVNTSGGSSRRPPPPPEPIEPSVPARFPQLDSDSGSDVKLQGNIDGAIASDAVPRRTRWIWDDNCKNDRPPFDLGRWIQVRYDECPIAFDDPDFDFHDNFCEPSPISDNYQQWYGSKLEGMWTYPEYKYCENVPVCLACPALGRCGPTGGSSGGSGSCTCNGYVNSRGQGECKTRYKGKCFCYVDSNASCEKFLSSSGSRYYSFEACQLLGY